MERVKYFLKDNIRLLLGLVVVIFFTILIASVILAGLNKPEVSINNETFKVEVADTDQEKQIGLSETKNLKEDQGMLFIFNRPDYYAFWMKNMQFPIDIIYIRGNKVTSIIRNAPVPNDSQNLEIYHPKSASDKVLEVNAGLAEKYNIKEGSIVNINNL